MLAVRFEGSFPASLALILTGVLVSLLIDAHQATTRPRVVHAEQEWRAAASPGERDASQEIRIQLEERREQLRRNREAVKQLEEAIRRARLRDRRCSLGQPLRVPEACLSNVLARACW